MFSGWSASDFVGPAKAVAELGYALWGKSSLLVPAPYRDLMVRRGYTGVADYRIVVILICVSCAHKCVS